MFILGVQSYKKKSNKQKKVKKYFHIPTKILPYVICDTYGRRNFVVQTVIKNHINQNS
jgi:hypothetical protein